MPSLILYRDETEVARLELTPDGGERSIGRDAGCDLVIPSRFVSRRHATVVLQPNGGWSLIDGGSMHGLRIGETRESRVDLRDGVRVGIGDHHLVFVSGGSSAPPAMRPSPDPPSCEKWERTVLPSGWGTLGQTIFGRVEADGGTAESRLQALFEISRILESADDFRSVLGTILDRALDLMAAERGFLLLGNPDTNELEVEVARDRTSAKPPDAGTASRSLMREVLASGRAVLVENALEGRHRSESVLINSIRSALCAPLHNGSGTSGVLYVDRRLDPRPFREADLAFFSVFAHQAKTAIDAGRSYWEMLENLFRASADLVLSCSPEGEILGANRVAATLLGRGIADLRGRTLAELVSASGGTGVDDLLARILRDGAASGEQWQLEGAGGRRVAIDVSGFALRDPSGRPKGFCLVGRDLTQTHELMNDLRETSRRLEISNEFIRRTFGRYLTEEVAAELLGDPSALRLGGERRRISILMADIRGFTPLSERLSPEQVVLVLNNYLGRMAEVVAEHGGTIDEFIGDAILVFFGAPTVHDDDARRAVGCSIAMQAAMREVNRGNLEKGLPRIELGIGVHTGEVVVGNIGSERRAKYGAVGSAINLASRIQGRAFGGQVLISEPLRTEIGADLTLAASRTETFKGYDGRIEVHEVAALAGRWGGRIEPEPEPDPQPISPPLEISVADIDFDPAARFPRPAFLVAAGGRIARLDLESPFPDGTSLRIELKDSRAATTGPAPTLFARVAHTEAAPTGPRALAVVRFADLPPGIVRLFERLAPGRH